ncbi:MAG: acetyl/propionyl/methylcrotonyl-CoA carboxylase subunit alpha [Alphaproteobacteria bacterium]|nr:acetyl/propionyl/methylcrotonyl-CoA carboxylase subunit alpha [Alphaproteobacteria bacterium]
MFDKILIANRGEIACRVIRTCRRMGVRSVAVFSDADASAMHVAMADEAIHIGPAPARESYLRGDVILEAARRAGAQAVHPGYGFLSENAAFARACEAAGVVFIGPPVPAIEAMGSKVESKRLMEAAGVPLVPGYHGAEQSSEALCAAARKIGFPVLVKASAGGGGKGMRVVRAESELAEAVASARREAESSFGDGMLLIEKYVDQPRHVEIQVFADRHGNVVHLWERDCSLQRRHQKVIEEAPAPGLEDSVRARMGEAGVAAARAVGYVGAGTVEFLYSAGGFYFIEMNTRLQVEHPVTEMITGRDLVEWQLRVAAGERLPLAQADIPRRGHAFEARLYAEDPARDFMPSIGTLHHLRPPAEGPHVRVDTGVREGDAVSIHYDPMIAKLIVWDEDRPAALRRLRAALAEYEVVGVATNAAFLAALAGHPDFAKDAVDTGFIERHRAELVPANQPAPAAVLGVAALDTILRLDEQARGRAAASSDPYSPWNAADGWRMNDDNHNDLMFRDGERIATVVVHWRRDGWMLDLPDGPPVMARAVREPSGRLTVELDGMRMAATVVRQGFEITVLLDGRAWKLTLDDPAARAAEQGAGTGRLTAPMPGRVVSVLVEAGAVVTLGTPLMVLEAMKMEHTIRAPADGTVTAVHFAAGDQVSEAAELLAFEAAEA